MLASLDNEVIFKKAFTDKFVFRQFVFDVLGLSVQVDKIETEKQFSPKIGKIDFTYDIFAETVDHRIIIEIQRVDYDYNFDRFLHYHMMAIAELQRNAKNYKIDQTVYTIVMITSPYVIDDKSGKPVKDDVMISSVDPRNLKGELIEIYGHKLIFLNPEFKNEETPTNYLDWLILMYESIHHPEGYKVNMNNKGIEKAVEIIDYDKLSPEEIRKMKVADGRQVTLKLYAKQMEEKLEKAEEEKRQAEEREKQAEKEKRQAEEREKQAEKEKRQAEEEKRQAEEREKYVKRQAENSQKLIKQLQDELNLLKDNKNRN